MCKIEILTDLSLACTYCTVQTLYPQNILVPNDTPLFDKQSKATIPQKQQSYHVVTNPPKGTHPQKQQPYQRQTLKGKVRDPNKHYCSSTV